RPARRAVPRLDGGLGRTGRAVTVRAEVHGDRIELIAPYAENSRIKEVPGRRFDQERRAWHVPLSWGSCVALRGIFGPDLVVGPGLVAWSKQEYAERVLPAMEAAELEDFPAMRPDLALFPFQRAGVNFLRTAQSALLGDEMGVGKTVQGIALLTDEHFPCLVVCPNTVKDSWRQHLATWAPHLSVGVVTGGAVTRRKIIEAGHDVVVINWEALRTETRLSPYGNTALTEAERKEKSLNAVGWQTVIADEAHRAKGPTSKQTRALWYVSKGASFRVALTGTPIANKPDDLWSLMHFVSP